MRCSECRHWGRGEIPIVGFEKGNKRHCGRYVYPDNLSDQASYLEAGDYAGSDASLWTEPDFYCSRFSARQ